MACRLDVSGIRLNDFLSEEKEKLRESPAKHTGLFQYKICLFKFFRFDVLWNSCVGEEKGLKISWKRIDVLLWHAVNIIFDSRCPK
jgi:hypothetical protein